MKCRLCGDNFYLKKSILELFNSDCEYICKRCYKKYPISLKIERIQLDIYDCIIISMFKKNHRINYNYFFKEYSKVFLSYFKREGYTSFLFDSVSLTDDNLILLDSISKLSKSNIIIVTFYTIG